MRIFRNLGKRVLQFSSSPSSRRKVLVFGALGTVGAAAATFFSPVSVIRAKEDNSKKFTLYQYDVCPYCNKVKAALDFYRQPYTAVEVNPLTKKETKFTTYKKVPILMIGDEENHNSTDIMKKIRDLHPEKSSAQSISARVEEEKWLDWVDDHFVHLLSPNIYRNPTEAFEAFDYLFQSCGEWGQLETYAARYVGAVAMYFVGKKLKKKHNIEEERVALYNACNAWMNAVGTRKMLGGNEPNLADLAIFGTLRAIHDMQTFRDVCAHTSIGEWYRNVEQHIGETQRLNPLVVGPTKAN